MMMAETSDNSSKMQSNRKKKRGRPRKHNLFTVIFESQNVNAIKINGDIFLCFPQLIEKVLKHIPSNIIHEACFILDIKYKPYNHYINKLMKSTDTTKDFRGTLIKMKDADRLCNFVLQNDASAPTSVPYKNAAHVFHDYFGGCDGTYIFDMDVEPRSRCIQCKQCSLLLSVQRFLCHSHILGSEKKCLAYDPLKWDDFVYIKGIKTQIPLGFFRKLIRRRFSQVDLHTIPDQCSHCLSEHSSPTGQVQADAAVTSNVPHDTNKISNPTNTSVTNIKLSRKISRKHKTFLNLCFSETPQGIPPAFTNSVSQKANFDKSVKSRKSVKTRKSSKTGKSVFSSTSIKSLDFLSDECKFVSPIDISDTDVSPIDLSDPEVKPFELLDTEIKPLDLPNAEALDLTTKTRSFAFSATKTRPFVLSAIGTRPDVSSSTEAMLHGFLVDNDKPLDLSMHITTDKFLSRICIRDQPVYKDFATSVLPSVRNKSNSFKNGLSFL